MTSVKQFGDAFRRLNLILVFVGILALPAGSRAQPVLQRPNGVFTAGGSVVASVVQDDGKIVIGGQFVAVHGVLHRNIARLNADGSVDTSFNPGTDGTVDALALSGHTIYIGGFFENAGGQPRNSIAAIDADTGTVTPWDPGSNQQFQPVYALAVSADGQTVYAGGQFSSIGGAQRAGIAALSSTDGGALPAWNPAPNSTVYALLIADNVLYVGGAFNQIGSQLRGGIAKLDPSSGSLTAWNPDANGWVFALAKFGPTIYVGGEFSAVGGQTRHGLAALDTTTGLATSWDPDTSFNVGAIALSDDTVYVAGDQTNFFAIDATSGTTLPWNPNLDNGAASIAIAGGYVYAGGFFTHAGGQLTGGLARIDASTAAVPPDQLSGAFGTIAAIKTQSDGKVLIGGNFTSVDEVPRNNIARLNRDGTVDLTWDPGTNVDGPVTALDKFGNTIYVAGNFQNIGGHFRRRLAAIDATSGIATSWQPDPDGTVNSIAAADHAVYVGGMFGNAGNAVRSNVAALDPVNGLALTWNPATDGFVCCIALYDNQVYLGGAFSNVAGVPRMGLALVNAADGVVQQWDPSTNGSIYALVVSQGSLYVGGDYYTIANTIRNGLAAFNLASGGLSAWKPSSRLGTTVESIDVSGDEVLIGGNYEYMGAQTAPRDNLAIVDIVTGNALDWNPGAQSNNGYYPFVYGAFTNGVVYIGGQFDTVDGERRGSVAAIGSPDFVFADSFE